VVGVDHPDLGIKEPGQQGNIILPEIMGVNQINVIFLAKLTELEGCGQVKGVLHGYSEGFNPLGLQSLSEQAVFIIGKKGVDFSRTQFLNQCLDISFGSGFSGVIQQVEYVHSSSPGYLPIIILNQIPELIHYHDIANPLKMKAMEEKWKIFQSLLLMAEIRLSRPF